MNGRWAYTQDSSDHCLHGLQRRQLVLTAAEQRPATVSLLPDRSSAILGLAAAKLLNVPAVPFDSDRADTVVVAYHLDRLDADVMSRLLTRASGQVLFEPMRSSERTRLPTPARARRRPTPTTTLPHSS